MLEENQSTTENAENGFISNGLTTPLIYQERTQRRLIPFLFSELFFLWTGKLMRKGYKGELKQVDDVFDLPNSLNLTTLGSVLSHPLENETSTFAPILLRVYGRQFFLLGILRFIGDILKFAGPILLHMLISSLQTNKEMTTSYICCGLMFITMLFASLCDVHFGYRIQLLSMKAKSALLLAVYEKLLRIPAYKITDDFSSGKLINLMCTDIDRIGEFICSFHAFWGMPMDFIIALYLIYKEMGLAFLAGVLASVILIPLNKLIASKIGKYSNEMMSVKDARLKLVSELSHSMRTIKLNSWENFFETKINLIRQKELKYLRYIKFLDAICVYLWASAPILITMMILATFTLILHEQLTAAKVFTTLALINILIMPLNAFPWVLGSMITGLVSKRRFDSFFSIKSTKDLKQFYSPISNSTTLIELEKNFFGWKSKENVVRSVQFKGEQGMLIGIIGPVGSGKSTLLVGILAETIIEGPPILLDERVLSEGFAYVGQDVWLRTGSVKENILCELPYSPERFRSAIDVCALTMDIENMPGKENYRIGGEGVTLSGGQKVRLALARAVYADKLIYLLDDPFAALDGTVASFVYENCIEKQLRSKGKLVILCTHHERFLGRADLVVQLDGEGNVLRVGPPEVILPNIVENQIIKQTENGCEEGNDGDLSQPMEAAEYVSVMDNEEKEEGTVKIRIYKTYIKAIGLWLSVLVLLSLIALQATRNATDVWLSKWSSANNSEHNNSKLFLQQDWGYPFAPRYIIPLTSINEQNQEMFYLRIYIAIVGLNSISTLTRAFLFAIACIYAAKYLHQRLLSRILKANINWWDKTPCGRVTNRLSTDVSIVDTSLPFQLNICLASFFSLIGTLILTLVALPLLSLLLLPLFIIYYYIQKYYRRTNVELKRICAITLSPLYSHLSETVSGLITIRSLRISEFFSSKMRTLLGYNLRSSFSSLAAATWLSVRIQMLGLFVLTIILFASILDVTIFKLSHPGLIGLAITYALSITNVLNGLLTSFIETEKELVSVERICDYIDNVPMEGEKESSLINNDDIPTPIEGHICFENVSLRYSPELPLAINNISFHLKAGTRTAIIGRTGAGKSTILQALLRAHPIETGRILIDENVDLANLGFKCARSLFGYVSQHPFLFSGTLFDNLSITNTNLNNTQIEACISERGLSQWLEQFGGLNKIICEGGNNLSFGERQLISLLRLSLTKPKIILIDEATAHMDEQTHLLMSRLISSMGCTLIAIVHRLTGLDEHYDWVIEMSNGQIAREGPPSLFSRK
uniref:ABC-type xenobiotic transporter n=1 Tax=Meloidogyne enterolobii TaxID=390850 RepID=A0A6V7TRZ8_MELEN|nr:unnamed protein product [Meloidogyne enterolobii]